MEQRNGRIDRKGQRAPEVRCHYFVFTQRPEDRVLATLVKKTRNIQDELGSLSQVLEGRLSRALEEGGIRRREADRLTLAIESEKVDPDRAATVDEELDQATRARRQVLEVQMNGLRDMMATAKETLRLDEGAFRAALSASLDLLGARPLQPVPSVEGVWTLPLDDPRIVKDPTWAETLDTLRASRQRDEKLWAWRASSPIRPLIFRDAGSLDDHYVHLHLEHRLVQRLLGRFLGQGFVHDDLARAAVVVSDDPIPRVALLGRLSLYGDRAARLHDEIVAVTARWIDPGSRREPLRPYAEDARAKTLDLVDAALLAGRVPSESAAKKLAAAVAQDVAELLPHLTTLGEERARRAEDQLHARGTREAEDLTEVLQTQKKRIQGMLDQHDVPQLVLPGFNEEERRQLEADVRHWKKRLRELDAELASEPTRVRQSYETRARRVDPIGVVYLWPVTG
jgi:hypothetical protein